VLSANQQSDCDARDVATLKGLIAIMIGGPGFNPPVRLSAARVLALSRSTSKLFVPQVSRSGCRLWLLFVSARFATGRNLLHNGDQLPRGSIVVDRCRPPDRHPLQYRLISFAALSAYLLLLTEGNSSFGHSLLLRRRSLHGRYRLYRVWQLPFWPARAVSRYRAAPCSSNCRRQSAGCNFAIATIAFARPADPVSNYSDQVVRTANGRTERIEGFRDIRYIFENDVIATQFMLIIYGLLGATLFDVFLLPERPRGVASAFRIIGEDVARRTQGVPVIRVKLMAPAVPAAIAPSRRAHSHLTPMSIPPSAT